MKEREKKKVGSIDEWRISQVVCCLLNYSTHHKGEKSMLLCIDLSSEILSN